MDVTREVGRRDRLAAVLRSACAGLGFVGVFAACGGAAPLAVEAPPAMGASSSAATVSGAPQVSPAASGASEPSPSEVAASALDWREHELVGFGGRLRTKVFASSAPSIEKERGADAEGSARATLKIPIGHARPIDCHLRAARLSAVEAVAGVAKLVEKHRTTAIQVSVSHVDERLVLRYALEVDDSNGGARVGTIRFAMAIGESDTALCTHLGGDDGTAFETSTRLLFGGLGGIAEKPAEYVDVVRVHGSTQGGPQLDVEHRLRARTPASGGPAEELGVSLTASIEKGELLVTETVSGLRLDATNEVTEATIATRDSRGSAVDVGVVRRAPKSYVMRVLVGGRDQMAPVQTSSPLTTELSMAPAIRSALDRAGAGGRAKLAWSELGGLGRGREVSVIESRELERDARTKELLVRSRDEVLRDCELDARGVLVRCRVERAGAPSSVVRERLYPSPSSAR